MVEYVWCVESDPNSLRDSEGIAHVLYFTGCENDCDGCHNPELQTRKEIHKRPIVSLVDEILNNKLADTLVFQGGEPTEQMDAVVELARVANRNGKKVWLYTGKTWGELIAYGYLNSNELKDIDVIISGPFEKNKLREDYKFLASSNQQMHQRIRDMWYRRDEDESS